MAPHVLLKIAFAVLLLVAAATSWLPCPAPGWAPAAAPLRYRATPGKPSRAIVAACAKHAVPPPPQLLPTSAATAAAAADLIRRVGTVEALQDAAAHGALLALSRSERERLALETNNVAFYNQEEAAAFKTMEEQAALRAAPGGFDLYQLNGLNIGAVR